MTKTLLKIAAIICVMVICITGCGTSKSTPMTSESNPPTTETIVDNRNNNNNNTAEKVEVAPVITADDLDIIEYLYGDSHGWGTEYFLIITNKSTSTIALDGNGVAYDINGNMIGAGSASIDVLGPNETSICYFYFNDVNVINVDKVEYNLSYATDINYKPIINNLIVNQTINNNNVIIDVFNNGDYSANFVEAYALFFDSNNNIIDYTSSYCTDDDYEIKPDCHQFAQLDFYNDTPFDHVEVYFRGRSDFEW